MDIFSSIALFFVGFFILIMGARILIRGAVSIASFFNVSTWFIGSVIVSIGTSIPELSINIASSVAQTDVGVATVIGSTIFNILVVIGSMSLFFPIVMKKEWVTRDLPIFIGISLLTGAVLLFPILGDPTFKGVSQGEGILLLSVFFGWLFYMFSIWDAEKEKADLEVVTLFVGFLMTLGGIAGVFVGGNWVVDGAVTIAGALGVSPIIIGFTIVALGTSLPELVVSITALIKGRTGIAVGNILGSSIFNFLGVFGITSIIRPIQVFEPVLFDIAFATLVGMVWLLLMVIGRKYTVAKWEGMFLIIMYIAYIISMFLR